MSAIRSDAGRKPDPGDHALRLAWHIAMGIAIACSIGTVAWLLRNLDKREYFLTNDLPKDERHFFMQLIGGAAIILMTGFLFWWRRLRSRTPGIGAVDALAELNGKLFPLLLLPFIAALSAPGIEVKHTERVLVIVALLSIIAGVSIYRIAGPGGIWAALARTRRWLPLTLLAVGTALYMGYVSYWAMVDHWNLHTQTFDLAIYHNTVWHTANGDFLGCSFVRTGNHTSAHFDPLLALIVPFYWIWSRAETLLAFQTVWLALGAVPIYLIAVRRLGNPWYGALLGGTYLLYPALHGVNMFDFHSLTMVVPVALWAVYTTERSVGWQYWVVLALLLLTREDISLMAAGMGIYLLVTGRTRAGVLTIGISAIYLICVKLFIMPDPALLMSGGKETYSFTYFYEEMIPHREEGAGGLLISALTNPMYAVGVLLKQKKVLFFLYLLLPLLFLPFAAGRKMATMLYGFAFIGLASRHHVFSLYFQYSSVLFPFLIAAIPDAIANVSDGRAARLFRLDPTRMRWTLACTVLWSTMMVSWKYGVIVPNDAFRAGWSPFTRHPDDTVKQRYEDLKELIAQIPPDAAVSATSTIGPHVSARDKAYRWPVLSDAEYAIIRHNRLKAKDRKRYNRMVRRNWDVIDEADSIKLLKKRAKPKKKRPKKKKKKKEDEKKPAKKKAEGVKPAVATDGKKQAQDGDAARLATGERGKSRPARKKQGKAAGG